MKKTGMFLIIFSMTVWIVDRLSGIVSSACCRHFCGEIYMRPFAGIVGDASCGFNADMYVAMGMVLVFVIGIVMVRLSKKEEREEEKMIS